MAKTVNSCCLVLLALLLLTITHHSALARPQTGTRPAAVTGTDPQAPAEATDPVPDAPAEQGKPGPSEGEEMTSTASSIISEETTIVTDNADSANKDQLAAETEGPDGVPNPKPEVIATNVDTAAHTENTQANVQPQHEHTIVDFLL